MFTFWSIVWAVVFLSFFNGLIHWQIPNELQIPDFILKTIGGLPSFYGYNLELDTEGGTLEEWLQDFVDEELENLPIIEFRTSLSQSPRCSLTKSSQTSCITTTPSNCNRNDESCVQYWFRVAGRRLIQCFNADGMLLNCNTTGFVQKIYHNNDQMALILSNSTANSLIKQEIRQFQNCETHFVKDDNRILLSIPIPEMKEGVSTQELTLKQGIQTTIFYVLNDYNKNSTLLWTLVEAHLNSSKLCTCTTCYELKNNIQIEMNKSIIGFTAQLLTETNSTFVNLTANYANDDGESSTESVGKLMFRMQEVVIDKKTPLFWRKPGRFDCPSELTCPLEFLYIFQVQFGMLPSEYVLEILFIIAVILYQRKGNKYYF